MEEKKKNVYTISVLSENRVGLLHRITIGFTRRGINIESLTVSNSEEEGVHRYTIVVNDTEENVRKLVLSIEAQVEVISALYHSDDETVFQEIALYKVPVNARHNGRGIEEIVRNNHARILALESDLMIIEKTGHKEETHELYEKLKPFGVLEFVRSGRVSIVKNTKKFVEYIEEKEALSGT